MSKRGDRDVWVYRYFDNDQQRFAECMVQVANAWSNGVSLHHDDVYWSISIGTSSSQGIPEEDRDIVSCKGLT